MKKSFYSLFAAASLLMLAACSGNDLYDPEKAPAHTTGDLVVPASFDWTTTRNVSISLTSPKDTQVKVYSNAQCDDQSLLAVLTLQKDKPSEYEFEVPAGTEYLYVQYMQGGAWATQPLSVATATKAVADWKLPETTDSYIGTGDESKGDITFYIPNKEASGILMFEDNYPDKGDYDLNDYVAGYHIAPYISYGSQSYYDGIDMELQIRAIGGSLPYRLCVELSHLLTSDIVDNAGTHYTVATTNPAITLELISEGNNPVVFAVNGTGTLRDGNFYNTERLSATPCPKLTLSIRCNDQNMLGRHNRFSSMVDSKSYNFFLQHTTNGNEIHLKGYTTTHLATNSGAKFATDDNFVWGIKVPALIPHPTERTDMLSAYPGFEQWVKSGGKQNQDWYKRYESDKVISPK